MNKILQKIEKHANLIAIIVIAVLTCIASRFLFQGVLIAGHDALGGIVRFSQLDKVLRDGFFPARWLPHINFGYGEPTFIFYAPFFDYFGMIFKFFGLSYVNALNAARISLWFLSGLGMYLLAKEFFGRLGGLIAGAAYIMAPYHLSQIYVRGSSAEFAAMTWLPFILWAFYKLWATGKLKYFFMASLFSCLLFLSHNILTMLFGPIIVVFLVMLWWREKNNKNLVKSFLALSLAGFCSLFFLLPAFFQKQYVQIGNMLKGHFNYRHHFLYFKQLIYSPWGYGASMPPNQVDEMSFMIGFMYWILAGVAIYILYKFWKNKEKTKEKNILLFFSVIFVLSIFFTLFISAPFWQIIPILKFVQFPWRFLTIVSFTSSFLAGAIMLLIDKEKEVLRGSVAVGIIILIVVTNYSYTRPGKAYNIVGGDNVYEEAMVMQGAGVTGALEYTPIWSNEVPEFIAVDKYEVLEGDIVMVEQDVKAQRYQFNFQAETYGKVRINTYYFPGWKIFIDGEESKIDYSNEYGLMDIELPAGQHNVEVVFARDTLRLWAEIISLLSLLILFLIGSIAFYKEIKKWKLKKAEQIKEQIVDKIGVETTIKKFHAGDYIYAIFLSLVCFVLYFITLVPTVYSGDSGEITSAIYSLGVPHPTGFPLYIITAKLFSAIWPFGSSVAAKINMFSGFCGALTVFVMYFVCRKILSWQFPEEINLVTPGGKEINISNFIQRMLAGSASLMLGFSLTFWCHSIATKVYTCTALLVSIQMLLIMYWYERRQEKYIYWVALVCGLGLCTHITAGLPALALIVIVFFSDRKLLTNKKILAKALLAGMIPSIFYLYIPWAARRNPYVNQNNPENLGNFIYYITQRDYKFKMANRTIVGYLTVIGKTLKFHFIEFTVVGFALAIAGVVAFWKKYKNIFYGLFAMIAGNTAIMMSYGNETDLFILDRYFLPSYLALSIFILLGLFFLWQIVLRLRNNKIRVALFLFIVLVPIIPFLSHFYENNQRHNYIVENFGHNLLSSIEPKSLLFTLGDAVSGPIWYLHGALDERPDVIIVEAALITHDWYMEQLNERHPEVIPIELKEIYPYDRFKYIVDHNFSEYNIYTSYNSDATIKEEYKYVPYGLVNKVMSTSTEILLEDYKKKNDELWAMYNYAGLLDENIYKEYMVREIVDQYAKAHNNLAVFYSDLEDKEMAMYSLEEALKYDPDNFPALYNLSTQYKAKGDYKKSGELLAKAKEVNPDFFKEGASSGSKYEVVDRNQRTKDISTSLENEAKAEEYLRQAAEIGQQGNHAQAIEMLEQAREWDDDNEMVRLNLGNAYALTAQFEKAVAEFEVVCDINPENSMAHLNIGSICLNHLQKFDKAIDHFQDFIELKPSDNRVPQIQEVLVQIRMMKLENK